MSVRATPRTTRDAEDKGGSRGPGSAMGAVAGLREAWGERLRAFHTLLDRPLTPYYLIVGITTLLVGLGLVMVLSTGSVIDLTQGESPYKDFEKQLLYVVIGLPLLWIAARAQPRWYRAAAYPLVAVSVLGLLLTLIPSIAPPVNGAARWITIGGFQFQPSELAKLALAVWGADLLARKEKLGLLGDWRHMLIPLLPGTAILALLVMAGDDLGTTTILLIVFLSLLWIAGTPGRVFGGMVVIMGIVAMLLIVTASYRFARLENFFNQGNADPLGPNQQVIQGRWALGSGGLFGVGLGASGQKWGWVPEDNSDFIFSIIGEELGLIGTLCVVALYGGLAYAGLKVARRAPDMFARLMAAAITTWIVLQAVVNIGSVIGVIPPEGVPLPLVSEGGSSLLVTMVALGMLMSFARRSPGAAEALAARGPGAASRLLSWVGLKERRL